MLGMVRADDTSPALVVRLTQQQALVRQPGHDVIVAVVGQPNRAEGVLRLAGHHAQGLADLLQGELAFGVELDQTRLEFLAAGFQVDAAGQAEVPHGVDRASVGVTCLGDGRDRCAEVRLRWLVFGEGVAPLVVAGRRLHDPGRRQRRGPALGADVVQHHDGDELAIRSTGAGLAVSESLDDEAGGVAVPGALGHLVARQKRRPGAFGQPVGVEPALRLLPHKENSLALWGQRH